MMYLLLLPLAAVVWLLAMPDLPIRDAMIIMIINMVIIMIIIAIKIIMFNMMMVTETILLTIKIMCIYLWLLA